MMHFIFINYSHYFIVAVIFCLLALIVIHLKANFPGKKWLLWTISAIAWWNLCAMLSISSTTLNGIIFWSKIEYLGANTTAPLLLLFFLNYPSDRYHLSKSQYALLFLLPAITILAVMTNELHYLFWTDFIPLPGITNGYDFRHGFFYWLALAFNYSCGTIAVIQVVKNIIQFNGIYRLQSTIILIASIFPYAAGLVYSLGSNPYPGLDILPIAFSIAVMGIVISVVFLRLFDLVPIGRNVLVENMQDGLIVINKAMQIVDINPAACRLLEPIHLRVGDPISRVGQEITGRFVNHGTRIEIEWGKEDNHRYLELTTNSLINQIGNNVGTLGVIRDITELIQMRQRLQTMATHDALTGLPNRPFFYDRFDLALAYARREKQKFCILALDLDKFKNVNDNMGHLVGDEVLVEVAERLSSTLRKMDTVARFGGDEFTILLWEINDREAAIHVAKKLLDALRKPYSIEGKQMHLTASVGIVLYPDHGEEVRQLIKCCDEALYFAKENGRNTYHYAERDNIDK